MPGLEPLLRNNRAWAARMTASDPDFFARLAAQQTPAYLWIGCADSRVPANDLVGMAPGEIFVHRNIANVVVHTDLNCLSVLHYAVEVLKVRHVIVCGHYGCGGVLAALRNSRLGLIDNWVRHIQDVARTHAPLLARCRDEGQRFRLLCALNVAEQVANVCETTIVQDAWARGQELAIHGWIYDIADGLLRELPLSVECPGMLPERYAAAVVSIAAGHAGHSASS
jgi:carbonic anhydrase